MHHIYPSIKGDPLCPLGFHPQVRWPTRCKRCFRDYKEHGGRKKEDDTPLRKDDTTASTPALSTWGTSSLRGGRDDNGRNWASSTNLAPENKSTSSSADFVSPASWTSTPDLAKLEDDTHANIPTVSITLPKRKIKSIDTGQRTVSDSFSLSKPERVPVFNRNDSLAARAKKLQTTKEQNLERPVERRRIQVKEISSAQEEPSNNDVQFLIQLKMKTKTKVESNDSATESEDDTISLAGTETTDTTLVDRNDNELQDEIDSLKQELDTMKTRCERVEREKSDILLRRLAAMETTPSKTTATEVLKLQQKCNELQSQVEDLRDEKKSLSLKVKELEDDIELRPTAQAAQKIADELRSKLLAAETLCEELMDENEDMKKELREMEDEMEEMQDNFREEQADEYSSLKKELEQTTKNCRILSFKLRKTERKAEQLETEKSDFEKKFKEVSGGGSSLVNLEKIKQLEKDLQLANEVSVRLQKELDETNVKLSKAEEASKNSTVTKKKPPMLGSIGKLPSGDGKVSRESLTRGGSQDDPVQLLRDLQDSLEREADLREQLKFAEEEAQNLRKKASRVEDDNESLVMQLKKMATKARSRKLSPTNTRLTVEPASEKDEGIAEEDPGELRILLELNEQESSVLRKKMEELETEKETMKRKVKDLQEKLEAKTVKKTILSSVKGGNSLQEQKMKVLEDEICDLRKKLIEKERDCERLHAELSLNQKRSKGLQKSKSLDMDQQTLDLKRQVQVIEQEAVILRTKMQTLETENEKLLTENRRLQLTRGTKILRNDKSLDRYIDKIATLEVELDESVKKIKELEEFKESKSKADDDSNSYKNSSKSLLDAEKTMKELNEAKAKLTAVEKELKEEQQKANKEKSKVDELNTNLTKTKDSLAKITEEKKQFKTENDKAKEDCKKALEDKNKMETEITKLKKELGTLSSKDKEITDYTRKIDGLQSELNSKREELKELKKDLDSKENLHRELTDKINKNLELEKQLKELTDKSKKTERLNNAKKEKIKELEKELEDEREKCRNKVTEQKESTEKLTSERKDLALKVTELDSKVKSLESIISSKNTLINQLEDSVKREREAATTATKKVGSMESNEINTLKDELAKSRATLAEVESKLNNAEQTKKSVEDNLKKTETELKKERSGLEKKVAELETEIQNEKKKLEVFKTNQEKEQKNRELELGTLRTKIRNLEQSSTNGDKKLKQENTDKIKKLETDLKAEKQLYDDLTAKYEILEEEHVVTKAKLVMEKETVNSQLLSTKRELKNIESELQTLRETYNTKQDTWIKEKLDMQDKLSDVEQRSQSGSDTLNMEKSRLKALFEEKLSEFDQMKRECEMSNDQVENLRRENDELKRKLDDFDKVSKIQRNISADSTAMDKEIRQLKTKLNQTEKSRKTDLAECKMRYDNQVAVISEELQSMQTQLTRFKRERDTYKHMLEGAQKNIADLKNNPRSGRESRNSTTSFDELEDARTKVATLEQQVSCMEDELSEARLESSKLKTELVSERSSWEVKMSELHSRVNELEEDRILSSGRTKIPGLRTRMELAWQKEREEQQRLLQETSTLARDLRQTLFEVERERDKERLEAKRKLDQFKKTNEEDLDESRRKLTEIQCDLLELRDAHAKLRTTNEKLRREKERHEKEREDMRLAASGKRKGDQIDDRRINSLLEQVETLIQLAPDLTGEKDGTSAPYTPTPPRRVRGPKSRESSPGFERKDFSKESSLVKDDRKTQIQTTLQRLTDVTAELRQYQRLSEDDREKERLKRMVGMRRAASTEHENSPDTIRLARGFVRNGSTGGSLYRKSLSLEQTSVQNEQNIWKRDDDSLSSLQSLDAGSDIDARWSKRDASMDSRLSGGSTQSEVVTSGDKKKKKGFMGKLKKLTKSRSIDDNDPGHYPPSGQLSKPGSDASMSEDPRGSKKDLKERLTGMFKRGGSSSRSNSVERRIKSDSSSTQRPLMPNGSNSNLSKQSST